MPEITPIFSPTSLDDMYKKRNPWKKQRCGILIKKSSITENIGTYAPQCSDIHRPVGINDRFLGFSKLRFRTWQRELRWHCCIISRVFRWKKREDIYLPSTRIGLLGPCRHPTLNSVCARGREVLVEHHAVPVTRTCQQTCGDIPDLGYTYASLVSGMSSPHSGLGFFIISSVT